MKNTSTPDYLTFTDLIANKKLTKENMHEAIATVAGQYMGFRSSAYQLDCNSNGCECLTLFAHFHGGKIYCACIFLDSSSPAIEAVSSALVKLNENLRLGFDVPEADLSTPVLTALEVRDLEDHNITDAFA